MKINKVGRKVHMMMSYLLLMTFHQWEPNPETLREEVCGTLKKKHATFHENYSMSPRIFQLNLVDIDSGIITLISIFQIIIKLLSLILY